MSIQYKLIKVSDNISSEPKTGFMPRTVSRGTYDLRKMAERMAGASSLTVGDIYSVLINLKDTAVTLLQQGYNVSIDDLGVFSVTAKSHMVQSKKEIRAESIQFKRVVFRTSKALNDEMKGTRFTRLKGDTGEKE